MNEYVVSTVAGKEINCIVEGKGTYQYQLRYIRKDGTESQWIYAPRSQCGNLQFVKDCLERKVKSMEQKLIKYDATLECRIYGTN